MKIIGLMLILAAIGIVLVSAAKRNTSPKNLTEVPKAFYSLSIAGLEGDTLHMSDFKGKYVLCVNVASKCGFTPQYKPLQELYDKYQDKLVVIGFPCNQFLGQEPGSEEEIASFCERNYGVTFPMTEKIDVKGSDQHPIYSWLTHKELNGVDDAKVGWNFNKFLISPEGEWLAHFSSKVDPLSEEIVGRLM
ncbi:MAG TPA: glutathione peroxidase [Saprospiraceae bacterium]|nr:glutathione peroxidase [Saprospiraceae bacterium]